MKYIKQTNSALLKRCFGFFLLLFILLSVIQRAESNTLSLIATPQTLTPDGNWLTLIHLSSPNIPVKYTATAGKVLELPDWVNDNSDAIKIILTEPTAFTVTATMSNAPFTITKNIASPLTDAKTPLQFTAKAVGPYLVAIGIAWLDLGNTPAIQQYQISRFDKDSQTNTLLGVINYPSKIFRDDTVNPNTYYEYQIQAIANGKVIATAKQSLITPAELPKSTESTLNGKGIILYIDTNDPGSQFYYKTLEPQIIIEHAKNMDLRYIQLRTVYGSHSHFNNANLKQWLNQLLDLAKENNIDIFSWSIPREDKTLAIASDIEVAAYTSPSGNGFMGCSLDLEFGPGYIDNPAHAKEEIINYAKTFRTAVGNDYFVTAMVSLPSSQSDLQNYPYLELAEAMNVLQPMIYWHYHYISSNHVYTTQEVNDAIVQGVNSTKQMAKQNIPINVIGQSTDLGGTGVPSDTEITTALQASKNVGAIGVSFFDWNDALKSSNGKMPNQAAAIKNFKW